MRVKVPLYARHGVYEVWVLDLTAGALRRCAALQDGSYRDSSVMPSPGVLALPGLPGCSLDLAGALHPA